LFKLFRQAVKARGPHRPPAADRGLEDPLGENGQGGQRCRLHAWSHVPVSLLKSLPRCARWIVRYCLPWHRHQGISCVVVPPDHIFDLCMHDFARQQFHFSRPQPDLPFPDQLDFNMEAYAATDRKLGPVADVSAVCVALHSPPVEVEEITPDHPPCEDILVDPKVPIVGTSSGWRPRVGGLKQCVAEWQRHRPLLKRFVPAVISTGAWLHWIDEPPPPLWLSNHRLTASQSRWVDQEVGDLLRTGAIEPYDIEQSGPPHFVGGINVIEEEGEARRLTWDPRYINAYLVVPKMKLEHLRSLALLIERSSFLLKTDMKSGYHHIVMNRRFAKFLAFYWRGRVYVWIALVFGLASAPWIFESVMVAFKQILRLVYRYKLMGYLDDCNFVLPPMPPMTVADVIWGLHNGSSALPVEVVRTIIRFGWAVHVKKFQAGTAVEMLGILVDSLTMRFSIPPRREIKVRSLLQKVVAHPHQSVRRMARIAGCLVSMQEGLRHAKLFLWSIYFLILPYALRGEWDRRIQIPQIVVKRCSWWLKHFTRFNGVDLIHPPDMVLQVDAAKQGAGASLVGPGICEFAHVDRHPDDYEVHNNVWELLAFAEMTAALIVYMMHRRVLLKGDNTYALSYMRRGGGSDPEVTALVQMTWDYLLKHDVEVVGIAHVPGKDNYIPDGVSRWQDCSGDWRLKPEVWESVRSWMLRLGLPMPQMDAFASALNHLLPVWCSRWHEPGGSFTDFFSAPIDTRTWVMWVNPPFSLMGRVLLHLKAVGGLHYVVAPWRQPLPDWWGPLQEASLARFVLPQDAFTSITTGHRAGFHGVDYDIVVHLVSFPFPP